MKLRRPVIKKLKWGVAGLGRFSENAFIPTIVLANQALGRAAFRPERALNASVTDAILVATAKRLAIGTIVDHDQYKNAVTNVITTPAFAELYRLGTTDKERVTQRIGLVLTAISGVH